MISIDQGNRIEVFKRTDINKQYKQSNTTEKCNNSFIRRIHKNGIYKIIFQQDEDDIESIDSESSNNDYNEENTIIQMVQEHRLIAVSDTLLGEIIIVGY